MDVPPRAGFVFRLRLSGLLPHRVQVHHLLHLPRTYVRPCRPVCPVHGGTATTQLSRGILGLSSSSQRPYLLGQAMRLGNRVDRGLLASNDCPNLPLRWVLFEQKSARRTFGERRRGSDCVSKRMYCNHCGAYVGNCGHEPGMTNPVTLSGTCSCGRLFSVTCNGYCLSKKE